jgi:hypothetical protein
VHLAGSNCLQDQQQKPDDSCKKLRQQVFEPSFNLRFAEGAGWWFTEDRGDHSCLGL